MREGNRYWVSSEDLGFGTYTKSRKYAEEIKFRLIQNGGTDANIQYDPEVVDIVSMDDDRTKFAYQLLLAQENSRSIYCESSLYGFTYRIDKKTKAVFKDGKQIASTCEYSVL